MMNLSALIERARRLLHVDVPHPSGQPSSKPTPLPTRGPRKPRNQPFKYDVFLSHNSRDKERIRGLAERLRDKGLRVWFDEWSIGAGEDIFLAVEQGLEQSRTQVLCLSQAALASDWVSLERSTALFRDPTNRKRRFVPLLLEDCEVPDSLRRYRYLDYRRQDESVLAEIAQACRRGSQASPWSPSAAEQSGGDERFAPSITNHMATLSRIVDKLTQDQCRVIQQLRGQRRVQISGCAGSGKTLVAAEKVIRLSTAGVSTLFLCHNPLLAEHLRALTIGSGVQVAAFGAWASALAGHQTPAGSPLWTNYEEPSPEVVERAFDALATRGQHYEAVIVDEGQDFRAEWWALVEAALTDARSGILYIFHDEAQSLLPFRSDYPPLESSFDLSRNCRNAGRVFELMRMLEPIVPMAEAGLHELGSVSVRQFARGADGASVEEAVQWLWAQGSTKSRVVLLGGSVTFEDSPFCSRVFPLTKAPAWQEEVRRAFKESVLWLAPRCSEGELPWLAEIHEKLTSLSTAPFPTHLDVELVRAVARKLARPFNLGFRKNVLPQKCHPGSIRWDQRTGALQVRRTADHHWRNEFTSFFQREDWCDVIPRVKVVGFRRHTEALPTDAVPVYYVGAFKGLEADAVLMFARGTAPLTAHEVYVGVSRARMCVALLTDPEAASALPPSLWRQVSQLDFASDGARRRDAGGPA